VAVTAKEIVFGPLKNGAKYDIFAATEVATIEIVVPTTQGEGIPQYPYMAAGSANDSARKGSTNSHCHLNVCISYGKQARPCHAPASTSRMRVASIESKGGTNRFMADCDPTFAPTGARLR